MSKILNLSELEVFFLIFIRMAGFFSIAPLFGRQNVPQYIKIGFSILLTLILYNTLNITGLDFEGGIYGYVQKIVIELLAGLILGFISFAMFTAIYVAGQLIDMQIGFGMVNVLDPLSNIQIPITSNFYFILSMIAFLAFKGHHMLIKTLFESYKYIPIGSVNFTDNIVSKAVGIFGNIFVMGFKIAAPITAAIIITDIALGVISRTVPQFNVFVVGMPLKIALGLVIIIITIPIFMELTGELFYDMDKEMFNVIREMTGRSSE